MSGPIKQLDFVDPAVKKVSHIRTEIAGTDQDRLCVYKWCRDSRSDEGRPVVQLAIDIHIQIMGGSVENPRHVRPCIRWKRSGRKAYAAMSGPK